jgi:DNA-binding beta-propeller fold protein YncE
MIPRLVILFVSLTGLQGEDRSKPSRSVRDPGVITTRQAITPAGVQSVFDGRVYGLTFAGKPTEVAVMTHDQKTGTGLVSRIDWMSNRVVEQASIGSTPGLQGLIFDAVSEPAGELLFSATAQANTNAARRSRLMKLVAGRAEVIVDNLGTMNAGAPAVAPRVDPRGRRLLLLPLIHDNLLAVFDLQSRTLLGKISVPVAPFACALAEDGAYAYVSNWGGRLPRAGELSAPTGLATAADRVVIDRRGILASGTVTRVNLVTMKVEKILEAGLHPTAMTLDSAANRLYVTNTNDDTVSVIETRSDSVTATWRLRPFERDVYGLAPTALLLSPDRKTLYVACGGINAVLLLDSRDGRQLGMIPTAWYPTVLASSSDGKYFAVSSLLGVGSGWQEKEPKGRYVHAYRGTAQVIPVPDEAQLRNYCLAVAENNRMSASVPAPSARQRVPVAVPSRPGDPSLIEHVVYIIKENRTYDQLFGDLEHGNGDPSLVLYGEGVADNHRKMAREFVLLDNFYASGGNSGDGHQWATQANETSYALWPAYQGRSYPYDGTDPIAYSKAGFIWDAAVEKGKTVAVYGEFAPRQRIPVQERQKLLERWKQGEKFSNFWKARSDLPGLQQVLVPDFPTYSTSIPDVIRADIFLEDLAEWTRRAQMPHLTILQLPADHTFGTQPAVSTPKAMVADNDLALGRVVEGLTRSPFWKKMAILVVEDDAQDGVDHVDGHRTVALALSPYVRRGSVDSTFYAHQSMLKTIELILGLEPLTIFDLIANDMRNSFSDTPDFTPYTAVEPKQDLFERNPDVRSLSGPAKRAALASARMRWEVPDAVPSDELNRILWHNAKGWQTGFPGVRQSVFAPMSVDREE